MGKNRFVVNPFGHLALSEVDRSQLKEFAYNFFDQCVLKYEVFISDGGPKVDPKDWKHIKTREDTRVYLERDPPIRTSLSGVVSDHPALLMTGITWGTVDDCMFGAYSPTRDHASQGLVRRRHERWRRPGCAGRTNARRPIPIHDDQVDRA